ncbi:MAG: LytR C-terminal domain-containing protein [bacterium]
MVNGTGIHRLARAVEQHLLNRGFNVYGTDDYPIHCQQTTVVDLRDPAGKNARALALVLAVRKRFLFFRLPSRVMPVVEVRLDSSRFVDAEIILGADYKQFFPGVVPLY